jgi:hypothetical protein
MAVAFVNYAEAGFNITVAANSLSLSTLTIASGSNLALLAKIVWNNNSLPPGFGIKWGSQTMQLIGTVVDSADFACAAIYGLVNPATGNQTLTASWTTASTEGGYFAGEVYSGVNQTGGATSFANFTTTSSTGTSTPITVTCGSTNDLVCTLAFNASGGFSVPWVTTPTDIWRDVSTFNNGVSAQSPGATPSVTVTYHCPSSQLNSVCGFDLVSTPPAFTATNLATGAAGFSNSQPAFTSFTPIWINTWVLDNGLLGLDANSDSIYICSQQPVDFTGATVTYALGSATFGAGNVFGSPANGSPNGRVMTSVPVAAGTVTASGTPTYWAVVDSANSRLLATGLLSGIPLTVGNLFSLGAVNVHIPAS